MNKKKLPKAVLVTADELREAGNARQRPEASADATARHEAPAAPSRGYARNVIEMVPKPEHASAAGAATPSSPQTEPNAEAALRRRMAVAIVERHANMSVMGGMLPVPILNVAGTTAIMVHMVGRLSRLYGVPFERNRVRATVVALMGGVLPTGLASATAWGLLQMVPGANVFGLVVSSVTAGACARSIGALFIDHFETGATLADFPKRILR
jgi:uncharacterized protein (DUF697 family)